jgi:hypothetical protein
MQVALVEEGHAQTWFAHGALLRGGENCSQNGCAKASECNFTRQDNNCAVGQFGDHPCGKQVQLLLPAVRQVLHPLNCKFARLNPLIGINLPKPGSSVDNETQAVGVQNKLATRGQKFGNSLACEPGGGKGATLGGIALLATEVVKGTEDPASSRQLVQLCQAASQLGVINEELNCDSRAQALRFPGKKAEKRVSRQHREGTSLDHGLCPEEGSAGGPKPEKAGVAPVEL